MAKTITRSVKKTYEGKRKIKSSYLRPKDAKRKSSSTAGKLKGDNCKKTGNKVLFCKDSRLSKTNPKLYNRIWKEEFEKHHKN